MKIIDLFAGIGGASYAADCVFENLEHIFVEINPFCQEVLKKHWPNSKIYEDIKQFKPESVDIVWASPPCQPASTAGKRRGTSDDRWLWGETFRVIRESNPKWCILENVRGILSLDGGLVFDSLLSELEAIGYEVWPFVIPACAVNAPHRRDRIWIIGHSKYDGLNGTENRKSSRERSDSNSDRTDEDEQSERPTFSRGIFENTICKRFSGGSENGRQILGCEITKIKDEGLCNESDAINSNTAGKGHQRGINKEGQATRFSEWDKDWTQIATSLCTLDDGISKGLVRFPDRKISYAKYRNEAIKACGNAVVPQVVIEIFKSIKYAKNN